ncbi:hypothetical protein ACWDAZ_38880, partial [Streptomyces sp. NPDC001215]
ARRPSACRPSPRRPPRRPRRIAMGYARVLAVHVPLGVPIIACTVLMLVWAWRPSAGPNRALEERV